MPQRKLPKNLRENVWKIRVGRRFSVPCLCCFRTEITVFNFHTGHIQAQSQGGTDTVDNLLPICASCNLSMGATNLRFYQRRCGYKQPFLFWVFH